MPSLLEALERKYFSADDCCQFIGNLGRKTRNSSSCSSNSSGVGVNNSNSGHVNVNNSNSGNDGSDGDIETTTTNTATIDNNTNEEQGISIFIPRISPLMCVPELLVLNDCDIDCAGDVETIEEKCKRVRELDLAQNKLDWQEVFDIVKHMPRIEFLNLSKNQLAGPITRVCTPTISNLRTMVLNGTYLDWASIDILLEKLLLLEELHLSLNNYKEVLIDTIETSNMITVNKCANNKTKHNSDDDNDDDNAGGDAVGAAVGVAVNNENNDVVGNKNDNGNYFNKIKDCDCYETNLNAADNVHLQQKQQQQLQEQQQQEQQLEDEQQQMHTKKCRKVSAHKALRTLHFTGNPIENWHEICRLGRIFPNLENLVLAECPIKSIFINNKGAKNEEKQQQQQKQQKQQQEPKQSNNMAANDTTFHLNADNNDVINDDDNIGAKNDIKLKSNKATTTTTSATNECANNDYEYEFPYKYFDNLLFLNLSYANLNTWDDIDQLAKFPKLKNLRVKHWPLWERLECTEHERRQLLIARLPNVNLLNGGGIISADEREDAERAFIRHYMDKCELERPQRYNELIAKHGKLDPLVNINLKPDKHVKIFITFKETTQPRLVDIYRTVADLKMKLEKIIGIPPNKMRLYYSDQDYKDKMGPEEMKFPNKFLYSYNIQSGDEIIIDEKK